MVKRPDADSFLKDVFNHSAQMLHDDGIYRHVRFANPGTFNMWFELITWPNHLTIAGDMGTWTFSRVNDMFRFFRQSELKINPSYWSEKLQHGKHDGSHGAKTWDDETFFNRLLAQLPDYFGFEGERLAEVEQAVRERISGYSGPHELYDAVARFKHRFGDGEVFQFDCGELPNAYNYTYRFIWCLYAIVWGIQQWDAAHSAHAVNPEPKTTAEESANTNA